MKKISPLLSRREVGNGLPALLYYQFQIKTFFNLTILGKKDTPQGIAGEAKARAVSLLVI